MAYDSALGELVLFGGITESAACSQDTLDLRRQPPGRRSPPATKPPARSDASMAYDAATNQAGALRRARCTGPTPSTTPGFSAGLIVRRPVLASATSPSRPVLRRAMAYDPSTSQVVLFGGLDASRTRSGTSGPTPASGLGRADDGRAAPRRGATPSIVYDSATNQLVLFGGLDPNVNTLA